MFVLALLAANFWRPKNALFLHEGGPPHHTKSKTTAFKVTNCRQIKGKAAQHLEQLLQAVTGTMFSL